MRRRRGDHSDARDMAGDENSAKEVPDMVRAQVEMEQVLAEPGPNASEFNALTTSICAEAKSLIADVNALNAEKQANQLKELNKVIVACAAGLPSGAGKSRGGAWCADFKGKTSKGLIARADQALLE